VNTNPQIMAWMMDTYSMNTGTTATGVVTGKPIHLGGSLGRVKATGRGVFVTGREAARRLNLDLNGAKVAVQGFGNVGSAAASCSPRREARSSPLKTTPARSTRQWLRHGGSVGARAQQRRRRRFGGAEAMDSEAFWDVKCDILVPAALEGQITADRARRTSARWCSKARTAPRCRRPTTS